MFGSKLRNRFNRLDKKIKSNIVQHKEEMPLLQFPEELEQDGAASSSSGEHSPHSAEHKIEQIREGVKLMITRIINMCTRNFPEIFLKEATIFVTTEEIIAKLKHTQQELFTEDTNLFKTIKSAQDEVLKIKDAFIKNEEYVIHDAEDDKKNESALDCFDSHQWKYKMDLNTIQKDCNKLTDYYHDISSMNQDHISTELLGDQ